MTTLSEEFRSISAKVYTFSLLCVAAKLFTVTSISQIGVKVEVQDPILLRGMLGVIVTFLTVACISALVVDLIKNRLASERDLASKQLLLRAKDLHPDGDRGSTFAEKRYGVIRFASFISFSIQAVVPIVLGVATSWFVREDVVEFATQLAIGGV